jgi:hypothetical protein
MTKGKLLKVIGIVVSMLGAVVAVATGVPMILFVTLLAGLGTIVLIMRK